jgi:hypothetical protein
METKAEDILSNFLSGEGTSDIHVFVSCLPESCHQKFRECSWISPVPSELQSNVILLADGGFNSQIFDLFDKLGLTVNEMISFLAISSNNSSPTTAEDQVALTLINCSIIENILIQFLQQTSSPSVILLKDALGDEAIGELLPHSLIRIFRHLFLPAGLNIRNLLWHGFMCSHELEGHYCSLFISLRTTCESLFRSHASLSLSFFTPLSINPSSPPPSSVYTPFLSFQSSFRNICPSSLLSLRSLFLLPNHFSSTLSALVDYQQNRPLLCLLKLLPALEHNLRYLFCLSNRLPEYLLAQDGAYYSTLDGFGQRSKHQLLLDPFLHPKHTLSSEESTPTPPLPSLQRRNRLLEVIGPGTYSLLVDLFFSDAGTNLRSLFAHDEINLAQLSAPYFDSCCGHRLTSGGLETESGRQREAEGAMELYLQEMALVLLVLYFGLCWRFESGESAAQRLTIHYLSQSGDVPTDLPPTPPTPLRGLSDSSPSAALFRECHFFVNNWRSHFHPHRLLSQLIQSAFEGVQCCSLALHSRRQISFPDTRHDPTTGGGGETRAQIVIEDCAFSEHSQSPLVQVWEKDFRLIALLAPEDIESVRQLQARDEDLFQTCPCSLRDQLALLCSAEQPKRVNEPKKVEKTVGQLVADISETCLSSMATLVTSSQSDLQSSPLALLLSHCYSSLARKITVLAPSPLSTASWRHSAALFTNHLSQFLDHLSDQMALSLLPGIACCGQLCQVPLTSCPSHPSP